MGQVREQEGQGEESSATGYSEVQARSTGKVMRDADSRRGKGEEWGTAGRVVARWRVGQGKRKAEVRSEDKDRAGSQ